MKTIFYILLFQFITLSIYSQTNLVLNYSFEDYTVCPKLEDSTVFVIYTPPWYSPTGGTPDLFNECSIISVPYSNGVPYTCCGFQYPRTGTGFAGFGWDYSDNCEYLTGEFSSPLLNGKKYCVEFYVNLADYSYYAYDRIGAYISVDSLHFSGGWYGYLHFIPQIENPAGNIITDTVNWTLISGEYIAKGGEQFITIGNFRPDSLVQYIKFDTTVNSCYPYYYLDDVSVTLCDTDSVGINEIVENKSNFNIYPIPASDNITIESSQQAVIEITNIQGQLIKTLTTTGNKTNIDVSSFPSGVYVVEVETESGVGVKKFVKE